MPRLQGTRVDLPRTGPDGRGRGSGPEPFGRGPALAVARQSRHHLPELPYGHRLRKVAKTAPVPARAVAGSTPARCSTRRRNSAGPASMRRIAPAPPTSRPTPLSSPSAPASGPGRSRPGPGPERPSRPRPGRAGRSRAIRGGAGQVAVDLVRKVPDEVVGRVAGHPLGQRLEHGAGERGGLLGRQAGPLGHRVDEVREPVAVGHARAVTPGRPRQTAPSGAADPRPAGGRR